MLECKVLNDICVRSIIIIGTSNCFEIFNRINETESESQTLYLYIEV